MAPVPAAVPRPQPSPGEVTPGCGTRGARAVRAPARGDRRGLPGASRPTQGIPDVAAGHGAPGPSSRRGLDGHKPPDTSTGAGDARTPQGRPQSPGRSGGRREGLPVPPRGYPVNPLPGSRAVRRAGSDLALLLLGNTATFCRSSGVRMRSPLPVPVVQAEPGSGWVRAGPVRLGTAPEGALTPPGEAPPGRDRLPGAPAPRS